MTSDWLTSWVLRRASIVAAGCAVRAGFVKAIADNLQKHPIQPWEDNRWARGLRLGMIRLEGHFCRIGNGKAGALSLFVRNENNLYVGFRRETLTQAATYVSLITDLGYEREATRFESAWMDVVVRKRDRSVLIYAENKSASTTLEKLCNKLETTFEKGMGTAEQMALLHSDVVMKAQHIWRNKPGYFWGVAPTLRRSYRVNYSRVGFTLQPIQGVPSLLEWETPSN